MALNQSQLEQLLSTVKKTGTNAVPNLASAAVDTKQNSIDSLTKQISNTSTRLAAVGEDATKIADTRNPLEKILNLTPDQSFIFDIFELINRPQQALFGAIEEGASGGNVLEGAIGGLTGNKDTQFKEVLQSLTQSNLGDTKGKLDLIDVVGFAGDVFLDPADLALMMVTGGTSLAGSVANNALDAGKAIESGKDLLRIGEATTGTAKAVETVTGTASMFDKAQDLIFGQGKRVAKLSVEDYLGALFNKDIRASLNLEAESLTSLTFKGMKGAFKGGSQLTDSLLTSGFAHLDSTGELSKAYAGFKKYAEHATSSTGKAVKRVTSISSLKFDNAMRQFMGEDKAYIDLINSLSKEAGVDVGTINRDILHAFEEKHLNRLLNPNTTIDTILNLSVGGKVFPYTSDTYDDLVKIFGDDIKQYMEITKLGGFDVIKFDEKYFSYDNYDEMQRLRQIGIRNTAYTTFDDKTLKAYEKTLEGQDIKAYQDYMKRKHEYAQDVAKRAEKRFVKEKGFDYVESTGNKKYINSIKKDIMEKDMKLGKNPQKWLQEQTRINNRYATWLTDTEKKSIKDGMSYKEKVAFNKKYSEAVLNAKTLSTEAERADAIRRVESTYDEILRKYAYEKAMDVEEKVYTEALKTAGTNGFIRMGKFQNESMRKYLSDIMDETSDYGKVVKKGVDAYGDLLRTAQRTVGSVEFDDAEALMRMSFEGYTTHTLDKNFVEKLQKIKESNPEAFKSIDFTYFAPGRTSALKSRQVYGSTYEANEFMKAFYEELFTNGGDKTFESAVAKLSVEDKALLKEAFTSGMFAEQSSASIFAFMSESYGAINKNKRLTDVLLAGSIGNPKELNSAFRVLSSGGEVPLGFTKLDNGQVKKLRTAIEANLKFQGNSKLTDDILNELTKALQDNKMAVMESHLASMFTGTVGANPKDAIKILDTINNGFKVGKTLSLGFNVKNIVGNAMNQWLSGVPVNQMFSNWNEAMRLNKDMQAIDAIIIDPARGIDSLTDAQRETYELYHEFMEAGFMSRASVYKLNDMGLSSDRWTDPASKVKTWASAMDNPITRANMDTNLWFDNHFRLSLYLYARKNPEYLMKLGIDPTSTDAAMQAVRLVHFDPNDLTFFEDDIMKRLVPFYTFTRQNMAFQLQNITRHSVKYNRMFKAYDAWNQNVFDIKPEDLQQYQREQMYVPLWKKKDGDYVVVKASFPMVALTELTFNPQNFMQNVASKTTPLLRAPFEAATGTQTFTGQPIERYQGELSTRIPMFDITKGTEWMMSQVGLDVPLSTVAQTVKGIGTLASGGDATQEFGKATNVLDTISLQDAQLSKLYSTIESLSAREKVLKSKGVEIPTLDAIQSASANNKLSVQSAQLQKITDLINNIKR